jgi:hypothetical protein
VLTQRHLPRGGSEQAGHQIPKMEDRRSRLERSTTVICDLLLGPPPGRGRLADRLDEAAGQLTGELAALWDSDAELEALWISAM